MTTLAEGVAAAFSRACLDELEAPKPGNVHLFAPGHRMTAAEFVRSANAAAAPLAVPGARVGSRILRAVEATLAAVGTNTNLGIILLCAPLAATADIRAADLRAALAQVLEALDIQDAELAFRAIARAAPAGLGRAERHDVTETASVSLKDAMTEASSRDRIARQYVSDFEDIFERGEPVLTAVLASGDLGRPFITPPGIAPERLKILREAFRKTMSDPAFLADVKARKLEPDPDFGEDLEGIAKDAVSQPKEIVERMKKLLSE